MNLSSKVEKEKIRERFAYEKSRDGGMLYMDLDFVLHLKQSRRSAIEVGEKLLNLLFV